MLNRRPRDAHGGPTAPPSPSDVGPVFRGRTNPSVVKWNPSAEKRGLCLLTPQTQDGEGDAAPGDGRKREGLFDRRLTRTQYRQPCSLSADTAVANATAKLIVMITNAWHVATSPGTFGRGTPILRSVPNALWAHRPLCSPAGAIRSPTLVNAVLTASMASLSVCRHQTVRLLG